MVLSIMNSKKIKAGLINTAYKLFAMPSLSFPTAAATVVASIATAISTNIAFAQDPATWTPPARDTSQIILEQEQTVSDFGSSWELDFYTNEAYFCGDNVGNYTFLVMNPADNPQAEAPLWVYMHGGGFGYYDETQTYRTLVFQDEDSWNHEEDFTALWDQQLLRRTVDDNGQPIDQSIARRIDEGYRVVAVSMCDHDIYSGLGTPYTNNPNGGEVNGLEATMAAVDYVVANYPTTHVFAHGTSAGGLGVWALSVAYAAEGTPLTAGIADFFLTERWITHIHPAFAGMPPFPYGPEYDPTAAESKIGIFADVNLGFTPIDMINNGFDDTPIMFAAGAADRFCAGDQTPLAEAATAGQTNCEWMAQPLVDAVTNQANTPHEVWVFAGEGHVPTNYAPSPAHDVVDTFLANVLAENPPYPFAVQANVPLMGMQSLLLFGATLASIVNFIRVKKREQSKRK